jgi:uncharacterized phage infection (PIP) family protein YhgE
MGTSVNDQQAERIDAYLGDGVYDKWHEFDVEADMQLSRKMKTDATLWRVNHGLTALSPYETNWVQKLQNDCSQAIDLIKQNKFPDPTQFKPLLEIFPAALDTADLTLSDAEAIPTLWLVAGAAAVPTVGFTAAAGQLHQELLELDELLREAQAEEIETEIKSLLGIVITTVELFTPGLGLLAKGGLTLVEAYLSDYTTPAAGSKYGKITLEAIEEVERAGHTIRHLAKGGGKALTVTGFYFDIEEVLDAKDKVKKIKALLEKANKEFKEIQDKISAAVKGYKNLQRRFDTSEAIARREIEKKRRERDDLIRKYAYSLGTPVAWKLVDDYSKFSR